MSNLIERLGKLQDSCNKQELGLLDTDYVFELVGRTADEIERLEGEVDRLALIRLRVALVESDKKVQRLEGELKVWKPDTASLGHSCPGCGREYNLETDLMADVDRLEGALRRLGSSEAMTISFVIDKATNEGRELDARLTFARAALDKEQI